MNKAVMLFTRNKLHPEDVTGKRVIEVGSFNVNGSVRTIIEQMNPAEYVGADIKSGPGVDYICDVLRLSDHFGEESFDVVACTEVVEHVLDWKTAISNLKRVLRPGGVLLLTTRSSGFPRHSYPDDHWRYRILDMSMIFGDLDIEALREDWCDPGVFILARKPMEFEERDLSWFELQGVE